MFIQAQDSNYGTQIARDLTSRDNRLNIDCAALKANIRVQATNFVASSAALVGSRGAVGV